MTYAHAIQKRLEELRRQYRIKNNNQLALHVGLRQSTIENLMKGRTKNPSLRTLCRIATGFGMTVSQLLDFPEMNESRMTDE